jgi:tetratricopeptide (TPR) repeat protein
MTARALLLLLVVVSLILVARLANGQEAKTVVGPYNAELSAGAEALLAGDAERGIRLTLEGLQRETRSYDRRTGLSNLCAGYILLDELETALDYCNRVLEETDRHWRAYSNRALIFVKLGRYADAEADLERAEAIAPRARPVRSVRSMLQDATDPVAPIVIIDDRREPGPDAD